MPQWSRDRTSDIAKYPDERAHATAPIAHAPLLRRFDHHVVYVGGRPALLLTYQWDLDKSNADASVSVEISFTYAANHPSAPREVQLVIDALTFHPKNST